MRERERESESFVSSREESGRVSTSPREVPREILRNRKSGWQVIIGVASNRHWLMANIRAFPTGIPCLPIERICEYNELRSFVPRVEKTRRSFSRTDEFILKRKMILWFYLSMRNKRRRFRCKPIFSRNICTYSNNLTLLSLSLSLV